MKKIIALLIVMALAASIILMLAPHPTNPLPAQPQNQSGSAQPNENTSCSYGSLKGRCLSPFGVFLDYTVDGGGISLDYAKELGITRTRLILHWWQAEPKKGQFSFQIPDIVINKHYDEGIETVLTLMSSSPWGTRTAGGVQTFAQRSFASSPPTDKAAYENFVKTVVSRYKDKVAYWQIENEVYENSMFWAGTKEEYVEHLKKTAGYIREADPDARIVLQGFAAGVWSQAKSGVLEAKEFFEYVVENSLDYVDALDFHHYEEDPASVSGLLSDAAKKKEILATEAGSIRLRSINDLPIKEDLFAIPTVLNEFNSVVSHSPVTEQACIDFAAFLKNNPEARKIVEAYQAEDLVKRISIALADGAKEVLWDGMRDSPPESSPDCFLAIMPLIDTDGRRKPHFYTYKMLIEKAGNVTSVEKLDSGSAATVIRYNSEGGSLFVVWDGGGSIVDLSAYAPSNAVRVIRIVTELDSAGNPVYQEDKTMPADSIPATKTPVFVVPL